MWSSGEILSSTETLTWFGFTNQVLFFFSFFCVASHSHSCVSVEYQTISWPNISITIKYFLSKRFLQNWFVCTRQNPNLERRMSNTNLGCFQECSEGLDMLMLNIENVMQFFLVSSEVYSIVELWSSRKLGFFKVLDIEFFVKYHKVQDVTEPDRNTFVEKKL